MDSAVAPSLHVEKPGGWEAIKNMNDPYVQEMGKFAVVEQPKPSGVRVALVEFIRVVSGETRPVADGKEYRLVVEVKVVENIILHGCPVTATEFFVATVLDKKGDKSWKVLSFVPLPVVSGPEVPA